MRYVAMAQMGDDHSLEWSNGLHSLKTGEIAFDAVLECRLGTIMLNILKRVKYSRNR